MTNELFNPLILAISDLVKDGRRSYATPAAIKLVNKHAPAIAAAIRDEERKRWEDAVRAVLDKCRVCDGIATCWRILTGYRLYYCTTHAPDRWGIRMLDDPAQSALIALLEDTPPAVVEPPSPSCDGLCSSDCPNHGGL